MGRVHSPRRPLLLARPTHPGARLALGTSVLALSLFAGAHGNAEEPSIPDAPIPSSSSVAVEAQVTAQPAPQTAKPDPCAAWRAQRKAMSPEQLAAEEHQYIGGVVPNFNTVLGGCAPALTAAEKWNLVYHSAVNPFTIGMGFVLGGVDEIDGAHKGYGWGPAGYFKRAGAQYADTLGSTVIGNGLLPVVLHQDPRYFQLGAGHSVTKRVWHAAISNFVCLGDNGRQQFNTSNVVGNFMASGLSNLYYPADERGVSLTLENSAIVTIEGALGAQLLEFSPELSRLAYRVLHIGHPPSDPAKP